MLFVSNNVIAVSSSRYLPALFIELSVFRLIVAFWCISAKSGKWYSFLLACPSGCIRMLGNTNGEGVRVE